MSVSTLKFNYNIKGNPYKVQENQVDRIYDFRYDLKSNRRPYEKIRLGKIVAILF